MHQKWLGSKQNASIHQLISKKSILFNFIGKIMGRKNQISSLISYGFRALPENGLNVDYGMITKLGENRSSSSFPGILLWLGSGKDRLLTLGIGMKDCGTGRWSFGGRLSIGK